MDGEADAAVPMRADALFGIASMTKPITSTAVMMLYEEDRFQLEDPVSRYIPSFAEMTVAVVEEGQEGPDAAYTEVPAEREITIRDLLRHTSGLTYDFMDPGPVGRILREELEIDSDASTLADFVAKLGELPLTMQPGSAFRYGMSTDVLGYLVQVVSGQPFEQFLEQRIFKPLGMVDTAFWVPPEKLERMTTLYAAGDDGKVHPAVRPYFRGYREPPSLPAGGAGLVSTAADYARFLRMLQNGGRLGDVRLLSRKSVELMTTGHLGELRHTGFFPGYDFGLGFAVRVDLGEAGSLGSVGEYAWSGLFSTYFFVDPHEEMFAILLTQTSPFNYLDLGERFKKLVYQAIDD
jgi:CubicO group peptidase (beta-lactamase class C family)